MTFPPDTWYYRVLVTIGATVYGSVEYPISSLAAAPPPPSGWTTGSALNIQPILSASSYLIYLGATAGAEDRYIVASPGIVQLDLDTAVLGAIPAFVPVDETFDIRPPRLMLRWSNDAAHTWSNEYMIDCGEVGEFSTRVIQRRLGQGRNRVFEISATDPIPWRIISGVVLAEECDS